MYILISLQYIVFVL